MDPKQKNHQTNPQNTTKTITKTTTSNTILSEFESRLVRLLSSDSYQQSGLNLAQLPKEFEKNFHLQLPKPREFGHQKLIQLLQYHCSSVKVEFREGSTNLAVLMVA